MRLNLENTELLLQENQPLGLINSKGAVVRCLTGTAWLTVAGEAGDLFLEAGQEHRLESDGLALIEPMGRQATIRLEPVVSGVAGLFSRFFRRLPPPAPRFVPYYREGKGSA